MSQASGLVKAVVYGKLREKTSGLNVYKVFKLEIGREKKMVSVDRL